MFTEKRTRRLFFSTRRNIRGYRLLSVRTYFSLIIPPDLRTRVPDYTSGRTNVISRNGTPNILDGFVTSARAQSALRLPVLNRRLREFKRAGQFSRRTHTRMYVAVISIAGVLRAFRRRLNVCIGRCCIRTVSNMRNTYRVPNVHGRVDRQLPCVSEPSTEYVVALK